MASNGNDSSSPSGLPALSDSRMRPIPVGQVAVMEESRRRAPVGTFGALVGERRDRAIARRRDVWLVSRTRGLQHGSARRNRGVALV